MITLGSFKLGKLYVSLTADADEFMCYVTHFLGDKEEKMTYAYVSLSQAEETFQTYCTEIFRRTSRSMLIDCFLAGGIQDAKV